MDAIKKFWKDHKIISILGIIILFVVFCVFYSDIASNFTKDNPNGEFFKVILSVLGGIGIIYGLWINSQRIKAQNKQNKLVEDRNLDQKSYDADKRFGEAIGYLGSENTSIVLGGIYALYQLAKEDDRYKPIVAGIFTSYLKNLSKKHSAVNGSPSSFSALYSPTIPDLIVNLLFSTENIFKEIYLNLTHTNFKYINFSNDINNCNFDNCTFTQCRFESNIVNSSFRSCKFEGTIFGISKYNEFLSCDFTLSTLKNSRFLGLSIKNTNFSFSNLIQSFSINVKQLVDCAFVGINFECKCNFNNISSFKNISVIKKDAENFEFKNCSNQDGITYL